MLEKITLNERLQLVTAHLNSQPRSALMEAELAVDAAKKEGNLLGEVRSLNLRGTCHRILSNSVEALADFNNCLHLSRSLGIKNEETRALTGLGSVYFQLGHFDRALDLFFRAQNLARQEKDLVNQFTALSSIGEVYLTLGQPKDALTCFQETYDLVHQVNDREHLATCLTNLGLTHLALSEDDKALENLSRALVVYKEMDNKLGEARTLTHIGLIYRSIGELDISEEYHQQGLKTFLRLDNKVGQLEAYSHLAELSKLRGQGEKNLFFLERLVALSAAIDSKFFSAKAYRSLGTYWEGQKDFEKALGYFHQATALEKYLKEEELTTNVRSLQAQMDFERSQAEAEILRLKTASLERQSQELRQSFQTLQALGEIGRGITATLKTKALLDKIYEILKGLVDTTIFGLALYKKKKGLINYRLFIENGEVVAPFTRPVEGIESFSSWCLTHKQALLLKDLQQESSQYLKSGPVFASTTEARFPQSLIYLPLMVKDEVIGLLTVQSYEKGRYTDQDLEMLQTLGGYISVALENSLSHKKLKKLFKRLEEDKEELERASRQIEHMANHDLLTGLANRRMLGEFMTKTLSYCARNQKSFAVFFLDLDGFKPINDTYGHEEGDLVLQEVGRRLLSALRDSDMVARVGGDEFVSLVLDVGDPESAHVVGQKILEAIQRPIIIKKNECFIGASIGVSFYPTDGKDKDMLLQKADHAMYEVKHAGKNSIAYAKTETPVIPIPKKIAKPKAKTQGGTSRKNKPKT